MILKVLYFLNLLERRRHVISLSNLFLYVALGLTVYAVVVGTGAEVIAAIVPVVVASLNYMYKRKVDNGSNSDTPTT